MAKHPLGLFRMGLPPPQPPAYHSNLKRSERSERCFGVASNWSWRRGRCSKSNNNNNSSSSNLHSGVWRQASLPAPPADRWVLEAPLATTRRWTLPTWPSRPPAPMRHYQWAAAAVAAAPTVPATVRDSCRMTSTIEGHAVDALWTERCFKQAPTCLPRLPSRPVRRERVDATKEALQRLLWPWRCPPQRRPQRPARQRHTPATLPTGLLQRRPAQLRPPTQPMGQRLQFLAARLLLLALQLRPPSFLPTSRSSSKCSSSKHSSKHNNSRHNSNRCRSLCPKTTQSLG
mmetsp:Transcript_67496/g.146936  ORF Transcript_67496/g.146936 Transcript_67496/m.146936 type:complete len:288 (-) Transcript_67496:1009-1872(-)